MRRAPIVVTATVLGTAGVLLFKPIAASPASAAGSTDSGSSSTTTSSGGSGSGSTASASSSAKASSTPKKSSTAKTISGTYTGQQVTSQWGTTQVKVTITGGKITDVATLQLNSNEQRSVEISESAAPILRQEVLSKQTAKVDTVSGATYTTLQYESSLQSALDKAGFVSADKSKADTSTSVNGDFGG